MKTCNGCNLPKPETSFEKRENGKRRGTCRACREQAPGRKRKKARDDWKALGIKDFSHKDYDRILIEQLGRCPICLRELHHRLRPAVDHDHETGRARGILCGRCNRAIGFFEEDSERLNRAASYVKVLS